MTRGGEHWAATRAPQNWFKELKAKVPAGAAR